MAKFRSDNWQNKAWAIRRAAAVKAAGGVDALFAPVLDAAFEIVRGADIEQMRELGGFSAVLAQVIGPAPAADINEAGMPESPEYWRYRVLVDSIPELRWRLQSLKARENAL